MKNYKKIIIILSVITLFFTSLIVGVNAATSSVTIRETGLSYFHGHDKGNGSFSRWGQVGAWNTSDGRVSYCVAPGEEFSQGASYDLNSFDAENLLELINNSQKNSQNQVNMEQVNLIELYAHYGYGYGDHNTTAYRVATQMLIWRTIDPAQVFVNTLCTEGSNCHKLTDEQVGVADEMAEIQRLVDNHRVRPSFAGERLNMTIGSTTTLVDTNGVLGNYQVNSCTNCTASISGNTLTLTATGIGSIEVNFSKNGSSIYTTPATFALKSGSQNQIIPGRVDPVIANIYGEITGGKIKITKYDEDTRVCSTVGDGTLVGAKYTIYNDRNEAVQTLTIGNNCSATSEFLGTGTYTIKETYSPTGYIQDNSTKTVTITSENASVPIDVVFYEKPIKLKLDLYKIMSDGSTGITEPEHNAKFEVYLKSKNQLMGTMTTDANGIASMILPYGTYVLKQIAGAEGHYFSDDVEIELKTKDESVYINNADAEADIQVVKIDAETLESIAVSGIKFKIWSVKKNDWVSFDVNYPVKKTIDEFETDENGVFYTPFPLSSGKYILYEQDQALDGYLWNEEGIEFTVDTNSEKIIAIHFANTPAKGAVSIIKYGEIMICKDQLCSYDKTTLEGVKFGVYAATDIIQNGKTMFEKDELVSEIITDEEGKAYADNLYLGKYYLKEIETVEDYVLDTKKYPFELKYQDQYTEVVEYETTLTNYLEKQEMEFYKRDFSDESILLSGATVCVYTKDGDLVKCLVTNEDGFASIKLPKGSYYYVETLAPEGYYLDPETHYFDITEIGSTLVVDIFDEFIIVAAPNTALNNFELVLVAVGIVLGIGCLVISFKKRN